MWRNGFRRRLSAWWRNYGKPKVSPGQGTVRRVFMGKETEVQLENDPERSLDRGTHRDE